MSEYLSIWQEVSQVPITQTFPMIGGYRTRLLEAGSGDPLVFVHGTGGHLEAYARTIPRLYEDFRVITFDMVGHGYSEKPDRLYTIDFLSDHVIALFDYLGIEKAFLSGVSIGGWVAAWTAAHHPSRVEKLILNTPGNVTNRPEIMEQVKESSLNAVRDPGMEGVRARVEWLFHNKSLVTEELIQIRHAIYTQPGFLRAMENMVAIQDWEVRKNYVWAPEWCGKIEAPTLLLFTDNDPTAGEDDAKLLLDWIPNSRLELIENTGHWPQWEKPDIFADSVRSFLHGEA
jgi:2-hydroxy-6-oxonona-2,4-dienedioate hydrolase